MWILSGWSLLEFLEGAETKLWVSEAISRPPYSWLYVLLAGYPPHSLGQRKCSLFHTCILKQHLLHKRFSRLPTVGSIIMSRSWPNYCSKTWLCLGRHTAGKLGMLNVCVMDTGHGNSQLAQHMTQLSVITLFHMKIHEGNLTYKCS